MNRKKIHRKSLCRAVCSVKECIALFFYQNIDTKQYIAEEIGGILYETVVRKLKSDIVLRELHRYIPETRKSNKSAKELFRKYFYSVVKYKERKTGIYTEFDEHMKQVLDMEFYRRIIAMCYGTTVT